MKKFAIPLMVGLFACLHSFSQLNPVNNLEWDHWYLMPNNYFTLSWTPPDPSTDTLAGYNVYRNNDFYKFQIETSLYHTEGGENCGEDFVVYNGGPFYIHVNAVYNSTLLESGYTDSAYCFGFLINITERNPDVVRLSPNPTTGKLKITGNDVYAVTITNLNGKQVLNAIEPETIDLTGYPKGIYLVRISSDQGETTEKVLLK